MRSLRSLCAGGDGAAMERLGIDFGDGIVAHRAVYAFEVVVVGESGPTYR